MICFSEPNVLLKGLGREEKKKKNYLCMSNKNCFLKDSYKQKIEYRKK